MLLLDSDAISAIAHGPVARRDRVRALVTEMRRRELPIGTVAAVLAEVVRGRSQDAYDDRVIVVLREGAPARAIDHVASAVGGCLEDSVEPIKAYRIRIPPVDSEKKLFQIISRIKDLPEVETAEPSFVLQIQ